MCLVLGLRFGERFPCVSDAYDRGLQQLAHAVAAELDYSGFMQEGVYSVVGGPSFETVAESKLLRFLGADAVGESKTSLTDRDTTIYLFTEIFPHI